MPPALSIRPTQPLFLVLSSSPTPPLARVPERACAQVQRTRVAFDRGSALVPERGRARVPDRARARARAQLSARRLEELQEVERREKELREKEEDVATRHAVVEDGLKQVCVCVRARACVSERESERMG